MVLVLFETAVGFCLFKMSDKAKVESPSLWKEFDNVSSTNNLLKLSAIHRFTSTVEAVEAAASINEGKMSKDLKKFLSEEISGHKSRKNEQLIVSDAKLGGSIAKKLGIQVVSDSSVQDLYRGIRTHLASLLSSGGSGKDAVAEVDPRDLNTMSLGLSHSLSRYKLKFSPDKVDTMVVQAIGLLDDLDKEVNIYAMRVKEWYGWHFPEMGKIITDNVAYSKVIKAMGFRTNAQTTDFSEILPEEIEQTLKAAAEISMGTEISDTDINHIWSLCDQVISLTAYRAQLYSYLQNRMAAIAPNLTALVGELVGARLISHSGSIMNLAKQPASTIQILGAEKALFRALKQKAATPKYGIVYHASLVGQAPTKMKGKMARMVATKAALSIRLDALADADSKSDASAPTIGMEARAKLESRLRSMEHQSTIGGLRGAGVDNGYKQKPFEYNPGTSRSYNDSADAPVTATPQKKDINEASVDASAKKLSKEEKKALKRAAKGDESAVSADESTVSLSKEERKALKKAKKAAAANGDVSTTSNGDEKERKKEKKEKKRKESEAESDGEPKKKKKRHSEA